MKVIKNNIGEASRLRAEPLKSIKQLSLNAVLYLTLYVGAMEFFEFSIAAFITLTFFLAFVIVRLFIIQHDCAHYAFFRKVATNNRLGFVLAATTHVPHYYWLRQHAYHHANSGNLQGRKVGDVWLLTKTEFEELPARSQLLYRLYRNPFVMVIAGGFFQFFIWFKSPFIASKEEKRSRQSIILTNLGVALRGSIFCLFFGWQSVIAVEILSLWIASMLAITLFYIQHNYQNAYWCNKSEWSHANASWKSSSFLNLCGIGHWLTGNIGYHHIHHLDVSIPNYYLAKAHKQIGQHPSLTTLSLRDIPKAFCLKLWDEETSQLVKFGA